VAEGIPARLSPAEGRRFGLLVGAAFVVLGALCLWRGRLLPAQVFGGLGAMLLLFGLVLPSSLSPVHRVWMGMALAISKVTTPLLLGIMYFGVITPIGAVRRLLKRDSVRRRAVSGSLWVSTDKSRHTDMNRQF
jgi:saxitoxin biosynthesis operon SxtJ-like protein